MLMVLGLFVFDVKTAPFSQLERSNQWRWAGHNPVGNHPSHQFLGRGENTITITGTLMPEFTGGPLSLKVLEMMGDTGNAWLLMRGNGDVYGYWLIENINEQESYHLRDGTAQKIDFSINLKRYDGDNAKLGDYAALLPLVSKLL